MVVLVERLLQITPCQDQAVAVVGEKVVRGTDWYIGNWVVRRVYRQRRRIGLGRGGRREYKLGPSLVERAATRCMVGRYFWRRGWAGWKGR